MEELEEFPFVVGEKVEARSNVKGYRGAWFRCEIMDIRFRKGEIWCSMQYSDFPDEKVSHTKAYQQDLAGKRRRALMLRPCFPKLCEEFDGSANGSSVGAIVVCSGNWQVGDLVDWWSDGCFWGAKITAMANKDFVQIELPNAPFGEGGSYEAAVKDIRPSLEWSVEDLWTVPSLKKEDVCSCNKHYSYFERRAFGINQNSGSLDGPVDQFECGKNERIFIAKQDASRSTVVRSSLVLDEELCLKRKAQVLEIDHIYEGRYTPDGEQHGSSCNAITLGMSSFAQRQSRDVKDSAAINLPKRLTRTSTSNLGDKTTLTRHTSRSQKCGIEVGPDLRGMDNEGKTYQVGQASGLKQHDTLKVNFCQHGDEQQTCDLCMLGWEEDMGTTNKSATRHFHPDFNKECNSPSVYNQMSGVVSDQTVDNLIGEGNSVNVDDLRVASAFTSLEELVSRIVWLKGVLQLGLKGWSQERNKQKWMLCERESSLCGTLLQDQQNGSIDQKADKTLSEGALINSVETNEMCCLTDSPRNSK